MLEATPEFLCGQAARFRRLAREIVDHHAQGELLRMAEEYEAKAAGDQSILQESPPPATE